MPTIKISDLTELTATPASDDLVVVVDSSTNETKKISYGNLLENLSSDTLTVATTATFSGATVADGGTVTTVDINGGTIDGSIIGGTTSAAGSFTTLSASGDVNFDSNTLFVDASANSVGIGTSSPTSTLDIFTPTNYGLRVSDGTYTGVLVPSALGGLAYGTTSNHPSIFLSNNAERMRIDSAGNAGIGTSSPITKLDVNSGIFARPDTTALVSEVKAVASDYLSLPSYIGTGSKQFGSTASGTTVGLSNASLGLLEFLNCSAGLIHTNGASPIVFGTTSTERMRITSAGTTLFNTGTVPAAGVDGVSINGSTNPRINMGFASNLGVFISFFGSSAQVGSIGTSGGSTTYSTSSDYRLKENVAEMAGSVDRVKSMNPVRFNFAGESQTVDGFLAHEIQAIVPEAVVGEKDAVDDDGNPIYQGIDQSKLVPVLVAAIKELTARIEALEAGA